MFNEDLNNQKILNNKLKEDYKKNWDDIHSLNKELDKQNENKASWRTWKFNYSNEKWIITIFIMFLFYLF